jgi:hypothetical protein
MRTALQHGSRPQTDTTASWSPLGSVTTAAAADDVGLLPEDYDIEADLFGPEGKENEAAPPPEEPARPARRRLLSKREEAKSGNQAVDTTVSWNPLNLETAAEALVMERRASTEDCTTARPITDQGDTRPVVAVAARVAPSAHQGPDGVDPQVALVGKVEFEATVTKAQTDTTVSWSPLGLETTAAAFVTKRRAQTAKAFGMKRRAPTEDCTVATPIIDQGDTRPVVAVAKRLQPWGRFDRRRIWPRFRKKYAGLALGLSAGVPKKSKRSSTR